MTINDLYKQHSKYIESYARKLCHNPELEKDMIQETWFKVVKHFDSYKPMGDGRSWLYSILRNNVYNHFRLLRNKMEICADDAQIPRNCRRGDLVYENNEYEDGVNFDVYKQGVDNTPIAEDIVYYKELGEIIYNSFGFVPEGYRNAADLFFNHNKSYNEIAEILNVPVNTVKTKLHRARKILQDNIKNALTN